MILPTPLTKVCPNCQEEKPLTDYHRNRAKANGRHSYCRDCNRARAKKWGQSEESKKLKIEYQRNYILRKIYGITEEIYKSILDKQGGKCAICQKPAESFKKRLAVEHCHRTGFIRGLCCTYCNRGLASYHDKPDYFRRAADYLEQNTGYKVPADYKKPKRYRRKRKKK